MSLRIALLGATGSIGYATALELHRRGHAVVPFARPAGAARRDWPAGLAWQPLDVQDPASVRAAFTPGRFDVLVSCLASRTGAAADAWAIDHGAFVTALDAARAAGVGRVVLLSAICVQKPRLAFQQAKLAAEAAVVASGLPHAIVRPTAFFKSLSGQVARVRRGRPFLVLGDGRQTACTPISDNDLAAFLANCAEDEARQGVLPVGGPGPALTPADQAQLLAGLLGRPVPLRHAPAWLPAAIAGVLGGVSRVLPLARLRAAAEFARIGAYYASESMLVWDARAQRYDGAATPAFGSDTLRAHYADLLEGRAGAGLGEHALFDRG